MAATERITMTMRELDRFKVIQDVADGKLKPWRAAERLGLTTRQIRRLVARLRDHGPEGLVSRRRSRPSNNQLDAVTADRALSIIRDRYADFGPTLACEKLYECHGIRLAKETVRRLMTDAGLWVPRRQRPPKIYQPRSAARVSGRADPDRWQRSSLVRGPGAGLHAAGVRRRCDEPADDAAFHGRPSRPSATSRRRVRTSNAMASLARSTATRPACFAARRKQGLATA